MSTKPIYASVDDVHVRASRLDSRTVCIEQDDDIIVVPRSRLGALAVILIELAASEG